MIASSYALAMTAQTVDLESSPKVLTELVHVQGSVVCRDAHESFLTRRTVVCVHRIIRGNDLPALVSCDFDECLDLVSGKRTRHAKNARQGFVRNVSRQIADHDGRHAGRLRKPPGCADP